MRTLVCCGHNLGSFKSCLSTAKEFSLMAMGKVAMVSTLVLTLLLMEAATVFSSSDAGVKIFNHVLGPLQLHCKSADDDFGEKTIADGQVFKWEFTSNFFYTTLYYCDFRWGAKTQHINVWTADVGCTFCVWDVTQDGFYKHREGDTSGGTFVAPWH